MWFVAFVASWLLSVAIGRMMAEDPHEQDDGGFLSNTRSTSSIVPLIYGRCRVGINIVYMASGGDDNDYLHIVGVLGEGPIHGIAREDGSTFTSVATQFPADNPPLLYLDGELWTSKWGTSFVYAEFFSGTPSQAVCTTLNAAMPEWTDTLRHTAGVYVRLKYDQDKFLTTPKITVTVDGLQLYNPTADATAYSDNFALMTYDLLTRPSTRGGLGLDAWHGPVPASPRVSVASIEAARAYCAAKGWTGGFVLADDVAFAEHLQTVLNCFRGEAIYSESQIKIKFRDTNHETPVLDITEADIVEDNGRTTLKIRPSADLFDLPNAVEATFFNADKKYVEDTYQKTDADALAIDGDLRKLTKHLPGLNTLEKLVPMANYYLERGRYGHIIEAGLADKYFALEASDLVTLTHSMPGWVDRLARVVSVGVGPGNVITVELLEENETLYDDAYNPSQISWFSTTLPDPSAPVPGVINASIAEDLFSTRLRSYTRLVVEFDPPAAYPWWAGAQVWVRIGTGAWVYMTVSRDGYLLEPVEEGQIYSIKLVSTNIWGAAETFDNALTLQCMVLGEDAFPSDISGMTAVANGDSVSIYATPLLDDNIEGYEVRFGSAWNGALFMSFNKAPSLRLNGVRPGMHTFWMAARNNAGNYSSAPVSATCRVFIPAGLTSAHSWSWDFTTGTFENTEHATYNSADVLKTLHVAASQGAAQFDDAIGGYDSAEGVFDGDTQQATVVSGRWTSPTYDMSALKVVRIWGDFLTILLAGSATWSGIFPNETETWEQANVQGKTWAQIFASSVAAQLQASLLYSENGTDWNRADRFEILCAEVYARYLAVEITITDPTTDTYLYLQELNMSAYTGPT
ncbi:MAG TPA: hypothetical protein DCZ95_12575 [Verrucomicrobia bacterium]|nr:hypothetical protein [Verrucomicrobiota bacterium]